MSGGEIFVWELVGTAVLILLGAGVVANTVLKNSLGNNGGWLLVNFGWGFAVFAGASIAAPSGAHLNPAVTLGLATAGKLDWGLVPFYFSAQLLGAFLGAVLCWLAYKLQFDTHDDPAGTLGIFSTGPTVDNKLWNTVTEVIGTFVLVLWILLSPSAQAPVDGAVPQFGNSALGYAAVMFVVVGIGASLGGPTGYAINPARDLGPRIAYAVLPIKGKGGANWGYSWVPVVGPFLGAVLAGLLSLALV
ncbi:glycerol uptake facilitator protein [Crossiella equi]|uniref:Glycerol uptake facilitator protein n=1 Tax=Crossiella equi TaxID=130796 RepID=A0ABS5ADK8_9PSEU|nr:MIP/aquaporin family protein [Crossiella equi]MBP2474668.1 glycerol uptake facilitator protein [Crossiella equi]